MSSKAQSEGAVSRSIHNHGQDRAPEVGAA